jgi:hypothetical protein
MDIPSHDQIRAQYQLVQGDGGLWNPRNMTDERIDELIRDGCTPMLRSSLDPDRPISEQVKEHAARSAS